MSILRLFGAIESEYLSSVSRDKSVYIIDKAFLVAWIEGVGDKAEVGRVRAFVDLLSRVKKEGMGIPAIYVPVDVLLEMKKEGKTYIDDDVFINSINTFFKIKEVDPALEMTGVEAVHKMAKGFAKIKERIVIIISPEKSLYEEKKNIKPLTLGDLFCIILLVYGFLKQAFTKDLKNIYENWLSDITNDE